jgi:hypothetical protein
MGRDDLIGRKHPASPLPQLHFRDQGMFGRLDQSLSMDAHEQMQRPGRTWDRLIIASKCG